MNLKLLPVLVLAIILPTAIFAGGGNDADSDMLMSVEELDAILGKEDLLILDIRDLNSYEKGHIPGALLLPAFDIDAQAKTYAEMGKPIVTYCSCPAEESSLAAAFALRRRGADNVRVLVGGYIEWEQKRRAIVRGARPY